MGVMGLLRLEIALSSLILSLNGLSLPSFENINVPQRDCVAGDFSQYAVAANYAVKLPLVEQIVQTLRNLPNTKRNNLFETLNDGNIKPDVMNGRGANNAPQSLPKSDHHLIPYDELTRYLQLMVNPTNQITDAVLFQCIQTTLQNLFGAGGNLVHKRKTWKDLLDLRRQHYDTICQTGGTLLTKLLDDVAMDIIHMIRWTPNNLFLGPSSSIRAHDPPASTLDTEIMYSLAPAAQRLFPINTANNHLDDTNFSYRGPYNKWNTILTLLVNIDAVKPYKGPTWVVGTDKKWSVKRKSTPAICYPDFVTPKDSSRCTRANYENYKTWIEIGTGDFTCYYQDYLEPDPYIESLCQ